MSEPKDNILDGPNAFPDFADPKWIAKMEKELGPSAESTELSERARKKKRIYKRKKSDPKPTA